MNCNEQEISIYRPFSLVQNVVEEIESKFQSHYSKGFDGDYSSKCNFSLQSDSFQEREFSSISLLSLMLNSKGCLNSIFKVGETSLLQIE